MRIVFGVLLSTILIAARPVAAQDTGPVSAFFLNGVLTTPEEAQAAVIELAFAWLSHDEWTPGVRVGLAYNPTAGLSDLIEAGQQSGIEVSDIYEMLLGYKETLDDSEARLLEAYKKQALEQSVVTAAVVEAHVAKYRARLAQGHKVIVVAHSQGNLFANAEWAQLTAPGERGCTFVVSVATPAGIAPGLRPHITLGEDKVIRAASTARALAGISTLPALTPNDPPNLPSLYNSAGHAFISAYLYPGTHSLTEILDSFTEARVAERPEASPCGVPLPPIPPLPGGKPCVTATNCIVWYLDGKPDSAATGCLNVNNTSDPNGVCRYEFGRWILGTAFSERRQIELEVNTRQEQFNSGREWMATVTEGRGSVSSTETLEFDLISTVRTNTAHVRLEENGEFHYASAAYYFYLNEEPKGTFTFAFKAVPYEVEGRPGRFNAYIYIEGTFDVFVSTGEDLRYEVEKVWRLTGSYSAPVGRCDYGATQGGLMTCFALPLR